MIWIWIGRCLAWLLRMIWPDPYRNLRNLKIDPNRACAVCGNKQGTLKFDLVPDSGNHKTQTRPFVIHTCGTCGFKEGLDPLALPPNPILIPTNIYQ